MLEGVEEREVLMNLKTYNTLSDRDSLFADLLIQILIELKKINAKVE